ncbi:putative cytochrome b5 [Aphelenchoides fujianensis]|nr:putative cytochrome b5 [Aphelenchoides fujianensis]
MVVQALTKAISIDLNDLPEFTEAQVRDAGMERCVVILYGLVYDLTDFLDVHPGGAEIIYEMSGMDATNYFEDVGHGKIARTVMLRYVIGRVSATNKAIPEHLAAATKAALGATVRSN